MIGVANRVAGYGADHERLLSTFANQVAVAITNARLYEQQASMITDLRALHAQLDAAQVAAMLQQERNRIAEDLHDRVAQILFSLGIGVTWCLERAPSDEIAQALERLRHLAAQGTAEIRRTVYDLAGDAPAAAGLVEQLQLTVGEYTTGDLQVNLVIDGRPRRLPYAMEESLHRVALEALTNVQRHAEAEVAIVSLQFEPDEVRLVVQDDGRGAPPLILDHCRGNLGHFGLKAMHRRMEALGGRLSLRNGEEGGLIVRATAPLPAPDPAWTALPPHTGGEA
jgi:signal transduction histidine kinase